MTNRHLFLLGFVFATGTLFVLAFQAGLPAGPGADLVAAKCQSCHTLQPVIDSAGISADLWKLTLADMESLGLELKADEREQILHYLITYLGAGEEQPAPSPAPEKTETGGEELYQRYCSACHQPDGEGVEGTFPPLADNPELFRNRDYPLFVLLSGLEGRITVGDQQYDLVMPPFARLQDEELESLLNFLAAKWGNQQKDRRGTFKPYTAAEVSAARKQSLTNKEILLLRNRSSAAPETQEKE